MGVDGDLTNIIREIVQFLESLYEVDLPLKIENARVSLLQRSRTKLSAISSTGRGSASPEPYLDMNAGKGFLLFTRRKNREIEIEEYVGVEEKRECSEVISHQDYYETFQEINATRDETNNDDGESQKKRKSWRKFEVRDERVENKLRDIYREFTAVKTMSKAHKCGSLYHKIERKSFGFVRGNIRLCWIGLVGSHLLIHASEDDKQPPEVCSIRGYSARPAPTSVSRDPERAKSAFEIFCPGNKTLQFIAKNPKEMEEWLEAISRTSARIHQDRGENSEEENMGEERSEESGTPEEKYQDVGEAILPGIIKDPSISPGSNQSLDGKIIDTRNSIILSSPPELPARTIPRRLPSLPSENIPPVSYEPLDDGYEEDDIYHKIEDFRANGRSYENVKKPENSKKLIKKKKKKRKCEVSQTETYDDVRSGDASERKEEITETYDDVRSITRDVKISNILENVSTSRRKHSSDNVEEATERKDQSFESYDDVFQSFTPPKQDTLVKSRSKDSKETKSRKNSSKIEKSPTKPEKTSHKRSFLDRVRHRKDSSKKSEKKRSKESVDEQDSEKTEKPSVALKTSETLGETFSGNLETATYDDVAEFSTEAPSTAHENLGKTRISIRLDEVSDYNCPPPPRPIYSKPPSPVLVQAFKTIDDQSIDEVYDDIGNYRESIAGKIFTEEDISTGRNIVREELESKIAGDGTIVKSEENLNPSNICRGPILSVFEKDVFPDEPEHYQTPRTNSVQVNLSVVQNQEQLYDDIAILADFRSKQRDSSSTSGGPKKSSSSSVAGVAESKTEATVVAKKPWGRFGSVKKMASRDSLPASSMRTNKSSLDLDATNGEALVPAAEKQETMKLNKLQKLMNKMESTLGKQTSSKTVAPVINKNHNASTTVPDQIVV